MSDGEVMPEGEKADLEQRIEENKRKIEEFSLLRDDPKIDKIIRELQKQFAQDSYRLRLPPAVNGRPAVFRS
jgi:hypothetical protein